jgi:tetratricopeptide (TPR) repeat protein
MKHLRYIDFELKIEREGAHYNVRVLRSPMGEAASTFKLPFSEDKLELLVLKIGRIRSTTRRIHSSEMEAARELGGTLFDAVFCGEVRACLRSSLEDAIRQEGTGLRIKLRLQEVSELADLPWEFLLDPALDRFLAQSNRTPVVRYLELPEKIVPLAARLPLQVLVMISSPTDHVRLDVERERSLLQKALRPLSEQGKVRIKWLEKASLATLQRCLREGDYHVFHFIGHGGFDRKAEEGVLVLEDERGHGWHAGANRLGTILHDHRSLRLAVLNSCEGARNSSADPFSGVATTLIRQGIPAVVAMQFEISDDAAITFADEFYTALAEGFPVDAAMAEARKAIYAQPNDVEWGTPVLYMRSPDGVLFNIHERELETRAMTELTPRQETEQEQIARQIADLSSQLVADLSSQLDRAEAQSDWDTVIELGERILMLDANLQPTRSKTAVAYNSRGMSYIDMCDYDRAFNDANRAIELDPKNGAHYYLRGKSYIGQSDSERAIADFARAIELDPNNYDYHGARGISYVNKGAYDQAFADLNCAIENNPANGEYYCFRGLNYLKNGDTERGGADFDRAIDLFNQAIALDPKNAGLYAGRAMSHLGKGDPDEGKADFDRAIELNPKNPEYYYGRAFGVFQLMGDADGAIVDLNRAIELRPKEAEYYDLRGSCYNNKCDWDRGIVDFNRAIELDPKKADYYYGRGDCYLGRGEYDRAIADLNRAIELEPKKAELYYGRGNCYLLKGDNDRAITDFNRAIKLGPDSASYYYSRATAYMNRGDEDRTLADLNRAIKLAPDDGSYYFARGMAYKAMRNKKAARGDFQRAVELGNLEAATELEKL